MPHHVSPAREPALVGSPAAADALRRARSAPALCGPSLKPVVPWLSGEAWRIVARAAAPASPASPRGGAQKRRRRSSAGSDDDGDGGSVSSSDADSVCTSSTQPDVSCRFCFGEADDEPEGDLVSPCACVGTQRWVHLRCLHAWQRVSQLNGTASKALTCDVCQVVFRCRPPSLPLRQQAGVALKSAALFALRAWIMGTAAASMLGGAAGALLSMEMLAQQAMRALVYIDRRAASSATFTTVASLALPAALPVVGLGASAVVAFYATFGGVFGLIVGLAGGPVLLAQGTLAAAHAARRATHAAAAALAAAAAAAAADDAPQ